MGVTANFNADFTSFHTAVQKAEVELADFAQGANNVGEALNRMVDKFSGRKLIQEAEMMTKAIEKAGGISTLTASQLQMAGAKASEAADKMRRLGIEVPQGLQQLVTAAHPVPGSFQRITNAVGPLAAALGVGFSVGAVVQLGRSILADADALVKLSDKTGISIAGLQRFRSVADDAGNTLDQLTGAVSQMQNRLASGDTSALAALDRLGLNLKNLRNLGPEQQFQAIARAIRDIQDPAEKVQIAMDLFGRSGAEILPSIKKGFDDAAASAGAMSEEAVRALDDVGDAFVRLARTGKSFVGELFASAITMVEHSVVASVLFGNRHPADYKRELEELKFLALNFINATVNNPALTPGKASSLGLLGMPSEAEMRQLTEATTKHLREIEQASVKQARAIEASGRAARQAETEYRAFRNEMAVLAMQAEATSMAVLSSRIQPQSMMGLPSGLLPSGELSQSMMGMPAYNAQTTLAVKTTRDWHQQLGLVEEVLGGIQTEWAQMAVVGARAIETISQRFTAGDWVGGLVAAGAAAVQFVGKLFGRDEEATRVNPLRDRFVAAAGGLDALNKQAHAAGLTLEAMLRADTVEEYEAAINDLTEALNFQNEAMQFVQQTMDKYGLSVADMGTAWSQQNLDEQAANLLKEFRALEAAGADVAVISEHMADALNEYVQNAIASGTTVPLAMREILNQLAQQGLLVDENGVAFEDLEDAGLTFSESMTESVITLTDAIRELVDAITRGLGGAITNLPQPNWPMPPSYDGPEWGGAMASGGMGRVSRPTLFVAGERGAEDFAFSGAGRRFGAGNRPTVLHNYTYLDGRIVAESVIEHFDEARRRLGV